MGRLGTSKNLFAVFPSLEVLNPNPDITDHFRFNESSPAPYIVLLESMLPEERTWKNLISLASVTKSTRWSGVCTDKFILTAAIRQRFFAKSDIRRTRLPKKSPRNTQLEI